MSTAKLYRAGAGIPGDVTRANESNVEPAFLGSSHGITKFGVPVKFDGSGKIVAIEASDAATVFKGILTRIVPEMSGSLSSGLGTEVPNADFAQGLLVRGYVNVLCTVGTPVRGGTVYMRVTADGAKAVGDLEATADGVANVALTGVTWASNGKDANNVAEIRLVG